jgi:short-subunit dehydrogenase
MENSKYVLISGATSDIGKSISSKLSEEYNLILHGRDLDKLKICQDLLNSKYDIEIWCQDLSDLDLINENLRLFIASKAIEIFGFIHCAGTLRVLPIKNFRLDYTKEIFNVNFFSAVEIIRTLELKLNNKSLNNIIFISAFYSKFGNKGNSIYAASKGALDSLVKSLAIELSPRVRVNSVLPGGIDTNLTRHIFDNIDLSNQLEKEYPLGFGECSDIAEMVNFLISNKSKWITGQNYFVDGGRSCY